MRLLRNRPLRMRICSFEKGVVGCHGALVAQSLLVMEMGIPDLGSAKHHPEGVHNCTWLARR
jgi:hypothetical protein